VRAVLQRVTRAAVQFEGETVSRIGPGLLVLLGVGHADTEETAQRMAEKIRALRIFSDADGRMNDALGEREILCVSQFTLYADTSRGNRPSFTQAAAPEHASRLYERVCELLAAERGRFGAAMELDLINDGPVTIVLEVT